MKIIFIALSLLVSTSLLAQSRIVSIDAFDLSYTGGLLFKTDDGAGSNDDHKETKLRLNLNYAQTLTQYPELMWKAEFHWNRTDVDEGSDSLDSVFGASGGLLFNFHPDNVKNSLFLGGQFGLERQTIERGNSDESGFNMFLKVEAGKRWDMGQYASTNISYAPTIELTLKRYGGDIRDEYYTSGHEVKLNFLKFDILF